MTEEVWKPVVGWEGRYEVSSIGRVRSVDCEYPMRSRWGRMTTRKKKGQVLVLETQNSGYKMARFCARLVHHLVAESFIGPRPEGALVLHANGDRTDNRAGNLRYGSPEENVLDAKKHGTFQTGWSRKRKLCPVAMYAIALLYCGGGYTQQQLAEEFGTTFSMVSWIVCRWRKRWTDIPRTYSPKAA